jgi:hypothetical protein
LTARSWYRNPTFEADASPQAIAAYLDAEKRAAAQSARAFARRIARLEQLLARRTAQQTAGTWPGPAAPAGTETKESRP